MKLEIRPLIKAAGGLLLVAGMPILAHAQSSALPAAYDERALRAELTRMYTESSVLPIPIHRGGGMHQPENTIEAFEYTWVRNMIPEADIRTSKDGVIVVIHDATVTRTAPDAPQEIRSKQVEDLTLAELKTVDVGGLSRPARTAHSHT